MQVVVEDVVGMEVIMVDPAVMVAEELFKLQDQ
jgi:hypothetical protein